MTALIRHVTTETSTTIPTPDPLTATLGTLTIRHITQSIASMAMADHHAENVKQSHHLAHGTIAVDRFLGPRQRGWSSNESGKLGKRRKLSDTDSGWMKETERGRGMRSERVNLLEAIVAGTETMMRLTTGCTGRLKAITIAMRRHLDLGDRDRGAR